ncbi:CBD9-like protein [Mycena venus]|uniref:CBD9-like protein n=1 Tax=Mycena venus TaxID=2733690 RepID=A0A8H6YH82_9AGAR|nr:CBD9-like protein [Mycena venus]
MVLLFFSVLSLFSLVSASSVPQGVTEFSKRDATGDSKCSTNMCIAAVVNGSTVQYTLTGTGKRTVGWMGMGFGTQMSNTPMVIMWGNSNGSVTLSQRQAPGEVMPTVVANPPRIATLSETLSTTSGNSAFVYTIPANSDTKQSLIFAFGTANPGSSDPAATLQQHADYGVTSLDLTKSLSTSTASGGGSASTGTSGTSDTDSGDTSSGATDDIPFTPYQRKVVTHAILCVVGFALLLPSGVLLARYLRTFTPTWYTGHWIAQFVLAGPTIIAGIVMGFKASGPFNYKLMDNHKKTGIVLFALYLTQCIIGALIHYVKAKNATRRPPQNYFHAVFGITIIVLSMYQIRTGYHYEWPTYTGLGSVPNGVNALWMFWVVILPVMYAVGLLFLKKQYRQEKESRKEWKNEYGMIDRYHDQ